ncbi:MAG TPA: response regulator transcription factor [Thermoanaerobaculaceae bacterium]|nr:response regulator transcription factor [Thermoanaerobaculaceae bacterium]HPS77791.1 response regulator transcription factor [Thermoanaerobaculaceae bacterium]
MSTQVFVVEDDLDIAQLVKRHLERSGELQVLIFTTGKAFLAACELGVPDVVILDLNLPDTDGLTLCRELRGWDATRAVPILMLTARAAEGDRVTGLELGADDYVTKPFSLRELAARVRALVRRVQWERGTPGGLYRDSRLALDPARFEVKAEGRQVHLTRREFDVLWHLVSVGGRVVSREQILDAVWGLATTVDARTVDAHIRTLRRKLGEGVIETLIGSGYRFRSQE